jgi:hypothetical protein
VLNCGLQKIVFSFDAHLSFSSSQDLIKIMAGALGAHLSIIARDVRLQLKFDPSISAKQVNSGSYRALRTGSTSAITLASDVMELNLGCLYIGECRDILIKFSLGEGVEGQRQTLVLAGASYTGINGQSSCAVIMEDNVAKQGHSTTLSYASLSEALIAPTETDPILRVAVRRTALTTPSACHVEVDAQVQRFTAFSTIERAIAWADAHNFTAAEHELDDLRHLLVTSVSLTHRYPAVSAVLNDLDVLHESMKDEDAYVMQSGCVRPLAFNQVLASQRCIFSGSSLESETVYQSLSSRAMQVVASSLLFSPSTASLAVAAKVSSGPASAPAGSLASTPSPVPDNKL